jgi:hypothetical protein
LQLKSTFQLTCSSFQATIHSAKKLPPAPLTAYISLSQSADNHKYRENTLRGRWDNAGGAG